MLLHAIKRPISVGAISPASRQLVANMVSEVEGLQPVVVELGAGTGTITSALIENSCHAAKIVLLEIDRNLAQIARQRFAGRVDVIVDNALELASYFNPGQADCILCSLPLTLFSNRDLDSLFGSVRTVLRDGGKFILYLYWTGIWYHRYNRVVAKAGRYFSRVDQKPTTWRNLPPARVIVCR